eukprot:scaffold1037_cov165-Ochromonas_danica.AAC.1
MAKTEKRATSGLRGVAGVGFRCFAHDEKWKSNKMGSEHSDISHNICNTGSNMIRASHDKRDAVKFLMK